MSSYDEQDESDYNEVLQRAQDAEAELAKLRGGGADQPAGPQTVDELNAAIDAIPMYVTDPAHGLMQNPTYIDQVQKLVEAAGGRVIGSGGQRRRMTHGAS